MGSSRFHALMYPWFAAGHITPFLYLANKLAEKGHMVTFLLPKKALKQLEHLNLFPHNIVFRFVTVPHVDGLPIGTETASEIPVSTNNLLMSAMDLTRDQVEAVVRAVEPDLIFFDFAHWIPEVARDFGLKTVKYVVVSASTVASILVPGGELGVPPPGYPSSKVLLRKQDGYTMKNPNPTIDVGPNFYERVTTSLMNCDAIAIRTVREIEGDLCDYIEKHSRKKVLVTGPVFPEPDKTIQLEERWVKWLSGFEPDSVVFCALGSQIILEKDQFQELCLGMELTGSPFLVVVKPPRGSSTVQEALPEGFEERIKGRGVVWEGWVQQPLILSHPSVGCFVSHCGFGSMWESLLSDCQIVLVPQAQLGDHIRNARLMTDELKVSVEVVREETGWFSKESLRDAINSVMKSDSEIGNLVKKNHTKWREPLASPGLMTGYVDNFIESLKDLVSGTNND
ncbi:PREDICTED: UDP-glycosyltransferase 79B3-like isoform X1 [Camelina sativa]|uniref:UDP-glycosyltransferase 79B3-like isoform X1 n=1 Tax=Camelina sativa TaxID=90675 RepID=A0ABM1QRT3_CAMSA|nr:PREDICTED: UDP-glycosyltransferase 79B3-like isoform X2 [Camelina sativa]XP_010448116.1 PREDICTED: UDP-glycosyltransferase 79B3-like isoform X3 [Camelina sativa]XP_019089471.1 PREDICTED: UDP-glycosyltransferase 79B3-like isoform X1 [Camelina sativa]